MKNQRLRNTASLGIRGAFKARARNDFGPKLHEYTMKKVREITENDEPIGIIISRGDRTETRPVFSAYIWGPAPEPGADTTTKVA
jgi:hypothetical protein